MSETTIDTAGAVLELLEQEKCAINMTGLVNLLPGHDPLEVKRLTNDLYMQRRINRVPVMGPKGRYYTFFAMTLRTTNGWAAPPELDTPDILNPDQAVELLERAGWVAEPEVVEPVTAPQVERRVADRRHLTALDIIKRWRLAYPLARVVDLIGESRRAGLSRDAAALAIRMIRQHVVDQSASDEQKGK